MSQFVTVCPDWEYSNFPGSVAALKQRGPIILRWIRSQSPDDRIRFVCDTRPTHSELFDGLTPRDTPYYAGHYRGEDYLCLRHSEVGIPINPKVGRPPELVLDDMQRLERLVWENIIKLDQVWSVPNIVIGKEAKLLRIVEVIAAIFCTFLLIHPYRNGNGHMARLIAIAIFSRYNLRAQKWTFNARPPDPYSEAIAQYQNGNRQPFVTYLLNCL
jgi:hypothetical protein